MDEIRLDNFSEEIHLAELETGSIKDQLTPDARVRIRLALIVLIGSAIFMLFAWYLKAYYPLNAIEFNCSGESFAFCKEQSDKAFAYSEKAAEGIYDFAKTWLTPVIALVLGYYFGTSENSTEGLG